MTSLPGVLEVFESQFFLGKAGHQISLPHASTNPKHRSEKGPAEVNHPPSPTVFFHRQTNGEVSKSATFFGLVSSPHQEAPEHLTREQRTVLRRLGDRRSRAVPARTVETMGGCLPGECLDGMLFVVIFISFSFFPPSRLLG